MDNLLLNDFTFPLDKEFVVGYAFNTWTGRMRKHDDVGKLKLTISSDGKETYSCGKRCFKPPVEEFGPNGKELAKGFFVQAQYLPEEEQV